MVSIVRVVRRLTIAGACAALMLAAISSAGARPALPAVAAGLEFAGFGDKVDSYSNAAPDGTRDGHFRLTVQAGSGLRVSEITLRTADAAGHPCCGQIWNTTKDGLWMLGVYRGSTRLNPTDAPISDTISGVVVYDLYGEDSGHFVNGQKFRVDVTTSAGTAVAYTTIGAPSRMTVSFRGYANNVRVLPPLVGKWQLGVGRIQGSGSIAGGTVSMTFTDTDTPRLAQYAPSYIKARVVSATFNRSGDTTTLDARVRITASSLNGGQCPVGDEGELRLVDSPDRISNGQSADSIVLWRWTAKCGHVHGWNNADQGARTQPPTGGPPNGGNWATVSIR